MLQEMTTPAYGHRLVPSLIDDIARTSPERVYASVPRSRNFADGYRDVRYQQLAVMIDRVAYWLEEVLDGKKENVAYLGPNDLRYHVILISASKIGVKVGRRT